MVVRTALWIPKTTTRVSSVVKLPVLTSSLVGGGLSTVNTTANESGGARLPADWTNTTVASVTGRVTESLALLPTRLAHTIGGFMMVLVVFELVVINLVVSDWIVEFTC